MNKYNYSPRDYQIKNIFELLTKDIPEPDVDKAWERLLRRAKNRRNKTRLIVVAAVVLAIASASIIFPG